MKNLILKEFNGIEYLKIKDIKINENVYSVFIDIKTQTKAIICDGNLEEVKDKNISNEVMQKVFDKKSNIIYERYDYEGFYDEIGEDEVYEIKLDDSKLQNFYTLMKKIFFEKFGNLLTEEEIDNLILQNIETVVLKRKSEYQELFGYYECDSKQITLKVTKSGEIPKKVAFHEFIHGICGGHGAVKIINEEENFVYGKSIDEGIVSYIENMSHSRKWEKFKENGSYDEYRRIVGQLIILYENLPETNDLNFIEQYIKDPEGTLFRINEIFTDYIKSENPNENDREINLLAMRESLNFVVNMDDIERMAKDNNEIRLQKMQQLEQILIKLYVNQISRIKVTTKQQLYELLYQIEGFNENLTEKSSIIENMKKEKIKEFLENNAEIKLYNILEELPKETKDSIFTKEERLFHAIFGDRKLEDPRYKGVRDSIKEVQNDRPIPKGAIGKAFGISVPVEIKVKVENQLASGARLNGEEVSKKDD